MSDESYAIDRRGLLTLAAGGAIGAIGAGAPALAFGATPRWPAVTQLIETYVARRRVPGALAMIGTGTELADRAVLAAGVQGYDDRRRVAPDTIWRLYSMTKPVTGMAVMALVGDGRLRLDQPVGDLLPAWTRMRVLPRPGAPLASSVPAASAPTVGQLITHSAGLGYTLFETGPLRAAYLAAGLEAGRVTRLPLAQWLGGAAAGAGPKDLAEFADRLAALPLAYQPGTRWHYSFGLDVAARVVEVAAGVPFARFLKERFFDPLGMTDTGFRLTDAGVPRMAANHGVVFGQTVTIDTGEASVFRDPVAVPSGGGGLIGTARDYDRFLAMLLGEGRLGGERVMSADAVRQGLSDLLPASVARAGTLIAGAGFGAGGRVSLAGTPGGAGIYGWAGAAGTMGFIDPRRSLRVGAYLQYMPATAYDFQNALPAAVLADAGA